MFLPDSHSNTRMEGRRERRDERTKKKEKTNMFGKRKQERQKEEDKPRIEKRGKRIVKGGQEWEEVENRKHSVCKSQIKSISVLHTKPRPSGNMALSA